MRWRGWLVIVIALCIVGLLLVAYSFRSEKRMYEDVLTSNVRQDMVDVRGAVINNTQLISSILEHGKITNRIIEDGEQADQFTYHLYEMMRIMDKYSLMNVHFEESKNLLTQPVKQLTGSLGQEDLLPRVLQRMSLTFERLDYTDYTLTPKLRERLEQYQELNARWLKIVGDSYEMEIDEEDWPQWVQGLESETKAYFGTSDVEQVRESWGDSYNPRYEW